MKKTLPFFLTFIFVFLLCSCDGEGKIIFPFEADFEKHYTELEISADCSAVEFIDSSVDSVILEDESYSVGINGETGALWFYDKTNALYYDMTGASFSDRAEADAALTVYRDNELFMQYSQGEFYDIVYEKYRPSLSAFYINENTVRLIYVLGLDQFDFISEYPVVLTEETYIQNEFIFSNHYKKADDTDPSEAFMTEFCTAEDYYVLYTYPLPESAQILGELDASDARKELLSLGYDPADALICMFVTDVSLTDGQLTVDISPNRQYRTSAIRTSQYKVEFFEGQVPFVNKTESESDKISFAGSKFG